MLPKQVSFAGFLLDGDILLDFGSVKAEPIGLWFIDNRGINFVFELDKSIEVTLAVISQMVSWMVTMVLHKEY